MSRFYSHVNTAKTILAKYKGDVPLAVFLKNFFSQEKKYGSKDRKNISSLCYNYYRIGKAIPVADIEQRLLASTFLCTNMANDYLQIEKPDWNEKIQLSLQEKIQLAEINVESIFPFNDHLSFGIDSGAFNASFLIQPDLFVRIRPGKKTGVISKLKAADIPFKEVGENSLAFANGTKLDEVLTINREVVIQDLNSQRVGEFLPVAEISEAAKIWDCCAASGGKSIMACDQIPKAQLTVSDVRQSIIQNLQKRLKDAGVNHYYAFVCDITNAYNLKEALGEDKFNLVICDAPCSGSGTWSRTPEQLQFFKESEITRYSNLQKSIAANAANFVKRGGYFLYITCSVFREENEEVVDFLQTRAKLTLVKMELLKGYDVKADSMFAALFKFE